MTDAPSPVERLKRDVLGFGSLRTGMERILGLVVLCVLAAGPAIFDNYWVDSIFTQTFILGIAGRSEERRVGKECRL